ncbi:unnamed protein product [Darwinula stevensoni]|uniref:Peptidase M24 domain-containing protein n=1 Tax=Darwinula stevensoni TaxID=69355 RepID=A0A7R9AAB5_9CRUS|nr:unnamed protein product [Darwinula stevensoni]CAG0898285.1 unnamed protein product [Darwinula stevensoni]
MTRIITECAQHSHLVAEETRVTRSSVFCSLRTVTGTIEGEGEGGEEERREKEVQENSAKSASLHPGRQGCVMTSSPTRYPSNKLLQELRDAFVYAYGAYLLTSSNPHLMPVGRECENSLAYLTGFEGEGVAIITKSRAALWVNPDDLHQADRILDCAWSIYLLSGNFSVQEFLKSEFPEELVGTSDSGQILVGGDSALVSSKMWLSWRNDLEVRSIYLTSINVNLVDRMREKKPECPHHPISVAHPSVIDEGWRAKVKEVRRRLRMMGGEGLGMLGTSLDETAFLFDLRGADFPYQPLFPSFLYLNASSIILFLDEKNVTKEVKKHLGAKKKCGSGEDCFLLQPYETFHEWLKDLSLPTDGKLLLPEGISYYIHETLERTLAEKLVMGESPMLKMKFRFGSSASLASKRAHLRDSQALVRFLAEIHRLRVEGEMERSTETKLKALLVSLRQEGGKEILMNESIPTVSSFGPSSILYHTESGAIYNDGVTKVSRTVAWNGKENKEIKEIKELYTRVLKAHIRLATAVFPFGTRDTELDFLARSEVTRVGLDYPHASAHSIGTISAYQDTIRISRMNPNPQEIMEGQVIHINPGAYVEGRLGARLGSDYIVVLKDTLFGKKSLGFEPLMLVPFDRELILPHLLSHDEASPLSVRLVSS